MTIRRPSQMSDGWEVRDMFWRTVLLTKELLLCETRMKLESFLTPHFVINSNSILLKILRFHFQNIYRTLGLLSPNQVTLPSFLIIKTAFLGLCFHSRELWFIPKTEDKAIFLKCTQDSVLFFKTTLLRHQWPTKSSVYLMYRTSLV